MLKHIVLIYFLLSLNQLSAYQSEDTLKIIIMGKVAKYITWIDNNQGNYFVITVIGTPFNGIIDKTYNNKKIKNKKVKIVHIADIDELEYTNILYIPSSNAIKLDDILEKVKDKNILTVSDIRGFAEKKGVMQIYFAFQKIKLKINLDIAKAENLKIKSSLLRVSKVIQEQKL